MPDRYTPALDVRAMPNLLGVDLCNECGSLVWAASHPQHDKLHDALALVEAMQRKADPCPECSGIGQVLVDTIWQRCEVCSGSGVRPGGGIPTLNFAGVEDQRPHSRACGWQNHPHGPECSISCPTCHGLAE